MRVVKINAIWCSGCLIMNRVWDSIQKKYSIPTQELDYDFDSEEVSKYQPGNVLPVFIFFEGNQEIGRVVGEYKEEKMLELMREFGDFD